MTGVRTFHGYGRRLLAAAAIASVSFSAHADNRPAPDPARLSADVKVLASDAFEGRQMATPGEEKTVQFIIERMRKLGLEPAGSVVGGARGWTQDVPLAKYAFNGPVGLSFAVNGNVQAVKQGQEIAVFPPETTASEVAFAKAPLVFVGYGVSAPERNWDDFKGLDLKGKVAVVLINDPDFETGEGDFGGKALTYYGRFTYKFEEATRRGALGVLIVHETAGASYGWATIVGTGAPTAYDTVSNDPPARVPLKGWIQRDFAVALFKSVGLDFEAVKKLAQTREFKPVELSAATFSASARVSREGVVTRNVLGRLPGTTKPGEPVIFSAHWDHLGAGLPGAAGEDHILNGAVDNATGIAGLLELARLFRATPRQARPIVFLATTAEESGMLGAKYYADNPIYPLETTVADINMDTLNVYGPTRDVSTFGIVQNTLVDDLTELAVKQGRVFSPDPAPETGRFFRSDHLPLAKRGLPAMTFSYGQDPVDGGVEAGRAHRQDYFAHRYHQPGDEWTPAMNFEGAAQDLALLYSMGLRLAHAGWPEWADESEFNEIRDRSAVARR